MNVRTTYALKKVAADWTSIGTGAASGIGTMALAKALGLDWTKALLLGGLVGTGTGLGTHYYRRKNSKLSDQAREAKEQAREAKEFADAAAAEHEAAMTDLQVANQKNKEAMMKKHAAKVDEMTKQHDAALGAAEARRVADLLKLQERMDKREKEFTDDAKMIDATQLAPKIDAEYKEQLRANIAELERRLKSSQGAFNASQSQRKLETAEHNKSTVDRIKESVPGLGGQIKQRGRDVKEGGGLILQGIGQALLGR